MSVHDLPGAQERAPLWNRLIALASSKPDAPALRHKLRGVWVERRWRDVVDEADRLAAGLRHLGVAAGSHIAVEGEITARLLLVCLAARAIDAEIVSIAPGSPYDVRRAAAQNLSLAVVQGRAAAAAWATLGDKWHPLPVVFDHATAHERSPIPGVTTIGQLRSLGLPEGWSDVPPGSTSSASPTLLWVEESTRWTAGLDILLDRWLESGDTLALPELLAAAGRDRAEAAPQFWLASPVALEAAALAIEERFPLEQNWSGRLVRKALSAPDRLIVRPLLWRLRGHLGLSRLATIDLPEVGLPIARVRHLFSSLGVDLSALDGSEADHQALRDKLAVQRPAQTAGAESSL